MEELERERMNLNADRERMENELLQKEERLKIE